MEPEIVQQPESTPGGWDAASVTLDGVTVASNTGTEAELRAELESVAAAEQAAKAPKAEKPAASRDEAGRFAAKDEKKPDAPSNREARRDPEARIAQAIARQKAAEQRAVELEARLKAAAEPKAPEKAADPKPAAKAERFPTFEQYLTTNEGASLEDYLDARDEWREQQREKATAAQREAETREKHLSERDKGFVTQVQERIGKDADWAERNSEVLTSLKTFDMLAEGEKPGPLTVFAERLMRSAHATAIIDFLSDHPEEFQRLGTLRHPDDVSRSFFRLEDSVQRSATLPDSADTGRRAAPSTGSAPKPPQSKATDPITPVRGSSHVADAEPGDDATDDEWLRFEKAKEARLRRSR